MEAAEDSGDVEIEWLPFELRPAPKALLEPRGDHTRVDLDPERLPQGAVAWNRNPPAALPASLDAAAGRMPRAASRVRCAISSTLSTRRSSAKGRTSPPTTSSHAQPSARGLIRTTRWRRPTPRSSSRASARFAPRRRGREWQACRRCSQRTGRRTGAWAVSKAACGAGCRSCHGRSRDSGRDRSSYSGCPSSDLEKPILTAIDRRAFEQRAVVVEKTVPKPHRTPVAKWIEQRFPHCRGRCNPRRSAGVQVVSERGGRSAQITHRRSAGCARVCQHCARGRLGNP